MASQELVVPNQTPIAPNHADRSHARFSASGSKRFMACPGSVRLSEGKPNSSSFFAREGTAAHEVGSLALEEGRDAIEFIDRIFGEFTVDEEMAEAVQVYLDTVRSYMDSPDDQMLVEQRFSLERLNPPDLMFGTSDCVIYKPSTCRLIVIDYKHGKGIAVDAEGNTQGRYYALGSALMLAEYPIHEIEIVIVQPRAPHKLGPIRTDLVTPSELIEWAAELFEAVTLALTPDAPLNPGDHCKFCPAEGCCPAISGFATKAAQIEFDDFTGEIHPARRPDELTAEEISRFLSAEDQVKSWFEAMRNHAQGLLSSGIAVEGFKLVPRRAHRKWRDEGTAELLTMIYGLKEDDIAPRDLRSPAQVEKLLPKGQRASLAEFYSKESSGYTLAKDASPTEALPAPAVSDFTAV